METKLKYITFVWDEEHKELIIEQDKVQFAIPARNLYSLRVFIARIYRKGFYKAGKAKIERGTKKEFNKLAPQQAFEGIDKFIKEEVHKQ
jgi:hypothetical protein